MITDNSKKLVVITGASSGIGAALARLFSGLGYPIALMARNLEAMDQLNLPNSLCQSVDITDQAAFNNAVKNAENHFGEVDCLINNAGFAVERGDFLDTGNADIEKMMQTNILGVIHGMQSVLPAMRKRKTGTIINISSLADRNPRPHLTVYAATKAAVKSLSESQRVANAQYNIRICHMAPAKILTPMWVRVNMHDQISISADDFAKTVLWVYQQPQNICIQDLVFVPTQYAPVT